jgi:hypothetical protein
MTDTDWFQSHHVTNLLPAGSSYRKFFLTAEYRTRDISQPRQFRVLLYFTLTRRSNYGSGRRIPADMLQACGWTASMCYDLYANSFTSLIREREICHCDLSYGLIQSLDKVANEISGKFNILFLM